MRSNFQIRLYFIDRIKRRVVFFGRKGKLYTLKNISKCPILLKRNYVRGKNDVGIRWKVCIV